MVLTSLPVRHEVSVCFGNICKLAHTTYDEATYLYKACGKRRIKIIKIYISGGSKSSLLYIQGLRFTSADQYPDPQQDFRRQTFLFLV
jgi:hypothetical protein